MTSLEASGDLPNACTLNGRCQEVCPVNIPLPDLMRKLREEQWRKRLTARPFRYALSMWAVLAKRPWLYRIASRAGTRILELMAGSRGRLENVPGAGGWTEYRDLPAPQAGTFMDQYKQGRRR